MKRIAAPQGTVDFAEGTIGTLPPRQPLTITNLPPSSGSYLTHALAVEETLVTAVYGSDTAAFPALRATADGRIAAAFERAATALADGTCPSRLKHHAVKEVLLWLAEVGIGFGPLRPPNLVDRLRQLVNAVPDAQWQSAETARRLGVSEATMRRRLTEVGTNFSEAVTDVRMAVALGLLQTTDLSVTQVAYEVGYASPSRFAIRFRNRFGLAPSELRVARRHDRIGTELERSGTAISAAGS
jgi:AraC-type DNA-binding domain-containing proteins